MLSTKELRLTNLVLHTRTNSWQEIFYICKDTVAFEDGTDDTFKENDIEGIVLTPEILEKRCGFYLSSTKKHWFINYFGFCLSFDGTDYCLHHKYGSNTVIAYLKYLHQLQNIFLLITGKELEIKL